MLNFNSINKTEKDIISSHDSQFKVLCAAIRDNNVAKLKESIHGYDLAKDDSYLARYAATIGSAECFRVILEKQFVTHRPEVLVATLVGGNKECIKAFGDVRESDLSAEAFAAATFKGNLEFLEKHLSSLTTNKEYWEHNLVSIAARQGNMDCLELILDSEFPFNHYDAIVTAGANEDENIIRTLLDSKSFCHGDVGGGVGDAAIVAATYGNSETLSEIFCHFGGYFIDDKDFAVGKSALCSEDVDTVNVYINNGGTFGFDNALAIAAGLAGAPSVVEANKIHKGNLDMFKLVESSLKPSVDDLRGLPLKTATAYGRSDIVEYIESK